jgi:hypothetical protein
MAIAKADYSSSSIDPAADQHHRCSAKCEQNTATPPVTTGGVFALGKPHVPVLTSDLNPEVARLMQCTKEKQHD